jgi:hypothetical protein
MLEGHIDKLQIAEEREVCKATKACLKNGYAPPSLFGCFVVMPPNHISISVG